MTTIPPNPEEALVTISTPTSDTVRVRDRVESSRFEFHFDDDVEIEEASTDELFFPVDIAARIVEPNDPIVIPLANALFFHDAATGEVVFQTGKNTQKHELPRGPYEIEIASAPVKLYLQVDSTVTTRTMENRIELTLDNVSDIIIGARSFHEKPAGKIQTPSDPRSVMDAVSLFGSALKTTSPERSWPTLRGYPPEIEIGPSFSAPSSIKRPDVDVTLEIPRTLKAIFETTPLAFYTAAAIRPLPSDERTPGIVAKNERFDLGEDLSNAAFENLRDIFMLDAVIRSEGIYPVEIAERSTIGDKLPWDVSSVYELPLGERIAKYLSVDREILDDIAPVWPLTIDVEATEKSIPTLTHLAEELAIVRTQDRVQESPEPQPKFLQDFVRADGGANLRVKRATGDATPPMEIQRPVEWNSQMHTSLLSDYPLGSNKTSLRSYRRHLDREAPQIDTIEVHVVCNEDDMREEDVVTEFYGVRDLLEFRVNIHYNLTVAELRSLLKEKFDFLHYIGHVDQEGILCSDGYLDARSIESVGVDAFLLNACRSVDQGEAFLDAGAIGGIATLYDIPNSSATKLGRTLSRLLNRGFTIRAALEVARDTSYLSNRWVSLGDGRISLTQAESGVPVVANVEPVQDGFELNLEWFETTSHRTGSLVSPNTEWGTYHVLPSNVHAHVTEEQLEEFFSLEVSPVRSGGNLYWTDEISPAELREKY